MLKNDFAYTFTLRKEDRTILGRSGSLAAEIDWVPALEWTELDAIRRERLPEGCDLSELHGEIRPLWESRMGGAGCILGFQVNLSLHGIFVSSCEFPVGYFRKAAEAAAGPLVESGELGEGESFRYTVSAEPRRGVDPRAAGGSPFTIRQKRCTPAIPERPMARLQRNSTLVWEHHESDMRVFIPSSVLRETQEASRAAGADETGGILIGNLFRDGKSREMYLEITAQVPAQHTSGTHTRLSFTFDTWTAVRAAVELRQRGETWLGWWHSHSYLKAICDTCEKREQGCNTHAAFLSQQDLHLHRTVFSGAHTLALVLSDSPCSGLIWALFGWRKGVIAGRGFDVLNPENIPGLRVTPESELVKGAEVHAND